MKKVLFFILLFSLLLGCTEDGISPDYFTGTPESPTFSNSYAGTYNISEDALSMLSTFGFLLDTDISDTFVFNAADGSLTISSYIFSIIVSSKDGATVLTGTTTNKDFEIDCTIENEAGIQANYVGQGSYAGDSMTGSLTITINGGAFDGNILEISFNGSLAEVL
jgi:hypothetical protein